MTRILRNTLAHTVDLYTYLRLQFRHQNTSFRHPTKIVPVKSEANENVPVSIYLPATAFTKPFSAGFGVRPPLAAVSFVSLPAVNLVMATR